MGTPSSPIAFFAPKSNTACFMSSIETELSRVTRSIRSLRKNKCYQSRRKWKGHGEPKREQKCSMKVLHRFRSPSIQALLLQIWGMKVLFCQPLAIKWKNFVLESIFNWEKHWDSVLERGLLLLIESKEFSAKRRESLLILIYLMVSEAHFHSLDFGFNNLLERIKMRHPLGVISVYHS